MKKARHSKNLPARKLSEDEVRVKIVGALNNTKFNARTISGIANEAHINKDFVVKAIKSDKKLLEAVKIYPRKADNGQVLLTTKERFSQQATFKDRFIDLFATTRVKLDDIN